MSGPVIVGYEVTLPDRHHARYDSAVIAPSGVLTVRLNGGPAIHFGPNGWLEVHEIRDVRQ